MYDRVGALLRDKFLVRRRGANIGVRDRSGDFNVTIELLLDILHEQGAGWGEAGFFVSRLPEWGKR